MDRGEEFNLIVSDVEMPGMNGWQFAQEVRKRGVSDVPLLALTAVCERDTEQQALRSGFARYLQKFDAKELVHTIHSVCDPESILEPMEASA